VIATGGLARLIWEQTNLFAAIDRPSRLTGCALSMTNTGTGNHKSHLFDFLPFIFLEYANSPRRRITICSRGQCSFMHGLLYVLEKKKAAAYAATCGEG
jgi:hypothetical protein